jgi:hypothetical protein
MFAVEPPEYAQYLTLFKGKGLWVRDRPGDYADWVELLGEHYPSSFVEFAFQVELNQPLGISFDNWYAYVKERFPLVNYPVNYDLDSICQLFEALEEYRRRQAVSVEEPAGDTTPEPAGSSVVVAPAADAPADGDALATVSDPQPA